MYKINVNELYHHGILGMKWGIRRYQNKDGTLTNAGKKHKESENKNKNKNKNKNENKEQKKSKPTDKALNKAKSELGDEVYGEYEDFLKTLYDDEELSFVCDMILENEKENQMSKSKNKVSSEALNSAKSGLGDTTYREYEDSLKSLDNDEDVSFFVDAILESEKE